MSLLGYVFWLYKFFFQVVLLFLWLDYFLCIWVWVWVFVSSSHVSGFQMFPYSPAGEFREYMMDIYWVHSFLAFTHLWLLFLKETSLQALPRSLGWLPLFCFGPDLWLFLPLSHTELIVPWITLRKSALMKGHTVRILKCSYSPCQWVLVWCALGLSYHVLPPPVCSGVVERDSGIPQYFVI